MNKTSAVLQSLGFSCGRRNSNSQTASKPCSLAAINFDTLYCKKNINLKILNFPIIEALKKYKLHFNSDQFISLDPNSAFGNLNLSWMEIVIRIECVNDLIVTLYSDFDNLQAQFKQTHTGTLDQLYRQNYMLNKFSIG